VHVAARVQRRELAREVVEHVEHRGEGSRHLHAGQTLVRARAAAHADAVEPGKPGLL
jgi:hypothetical protein